MFMSINFDRNRQRKIYETRRTCTNYKKLFRFTKENVDWLSLEFLGENFETRGGRLTNHQRMQAFLRYMSDPGYQRGVGEDIGIESSTVCRTIWYVAQRIYAKADDWIKFPSNDIEFIDAMRSWKKRKQFPHAIGAIDCTHITILKPTHFGDEYINRKNDASLNVQAICDSTGRFMNVDCSWPGSVHDSRIWHNSGIKEMMQANRFGALLIGDEGYGISPYMMTPYRKPVQPHEKIYNKLHTKERVIIECAFGKLKARFPILKGKVRLKTERIPTIIVCCFILHNVAIHLNDPGFEDSDEEFELPDEQFQVSAGQGNLRIRGINRRNDIAHSLVLGEQV